MKAKRGGEKKKEEKEKADYKQIERKANKDCNFIFDPLFFFSFLMSSEPILFPKLRIYFADFPYLLFSI
ncbi:hypothetical protein PFMALIP_01878 [Plasmodium falciparum MaliPS096_E11]|uniref:Uncharacterized protein n=1 Tax=Plasmodium falciparum MaliPS096_E11 TaxID=1036727 RepID=A0A024WTH5_PLAFA|nr:hypothetical protein PFMALIP_01878 [Plasmodium falciparum MaliPS096_E11]